MTIGRFVFGESDGCERAEHPTRRGFPVGLPLLKPPYKAVPFSLSFAQIRGFDHEDPRVRRFECLLNVHERLYSFSREPDGLFH